MSVLIELVVPQVAALPRGTTITRPFLCTWRTTDGTRATLIVHGQSYFDARRAAKENAILAGKELVAGSLAVQQVRR